MPAKSVKSRGRILTTLQLATCLYTYVMPPPRFFFDFDALAPRFDETLTLLEKDKHVSSIPCSRRRKGVDPWTFLLGCVRVDHRNMGSPNLP